MINKNILVIITIVMSLVSQALLAGSSPEPKRSSLVYSTIQPGTTDIILFRGTVPQQITNSRGLDYNPTVSPCGRWLVFTSERAGIAHLYAKDLKHLAIPSFRLTTGDHFEDQASFSPDGKYLYFVSSRDGNSDIYRMAFSPEVTVDINHLENLTHHVGSNLHPNISPDGKQIVFSSVRGEISKKFTAPKPVLDAYATDIYVMNTNGTGVHQLTHTSSWEGSPVWSPDGKKIYFYSTREGKPRIYRMDPMGNNVMPISPEDKEALSPAITPSGRLAYATNWYGRWVIVSTDLEGNDLQFESDTRLDYRGPTYNPKTGQLLVSADSPSSEPDFLSEDPFAKYINKRLGVGAFFVNKYTKEIAGKRVDIRAVRGYFPVPDLPQDTMLSIKELSKIVESDRYGSQMRLIFKAPQQQSLLGLSESHDHRWLVTSVGQPYASAEENVDIWLVRRDGSEAKNITENQIGNKAFARFTPDDKYLIYRGAYKGNKNIFIMDKEGNHARRLTHTEGIDTMPDISPKGDRLVFSSMKTDHYYNLYILELKPGYQPGKLWQLTNNSGADMHPSFSPDGEWVVFTSERDGILDELPLIHIYSPRPFGEIYAIRLKDKKIVRVTESKWENALPRWR